VRRYLVSVAAAVLAVSGCSGSTAEPRPSASPEPDQSSPSAPALLGPVGLAEAPDGTVWVAWSGSGSIGPVGPDGEPGAPVTVGDTPLRMVLHDGSLWVTTIRDGGLHQVDPAAGTVVRTVELGGEPEGLTSYANHVFVVLQADAVLAEVDPSNGEVLRKVDVGGEPRMVTAAKDALFVGDNAGGRVVRVQPGKDAAVTRSKPLCAGVQDLQVLGDRVWAACMTDGSVAAFDARTLELLETIKVEGDPDGLTPGSGSTLLVSLQDGPSLAALDTTTGAVTRVFTGTSGRLFDRANNDVLERDGTAFVSDYTGNAIHVVPPG
jgi:streptogramin lyase